MTRSSNANSAPPVSERKSPAPVESPEPARRRALGKGLESLLSRPLPAERERSIAIPAPGGERPERKGFGNAPEQTDSPAPAARAGESGGAIAIPVQQIEPNPYQTRRAINEQALSELAKSIAATGVVQPIIVRKLADERYQLISGERRWRASQLAGKATVPAVLREASDEQALEITIVENLQREDLNPMEQARAFERLGREFRMTQEQIAIRTGKDRATVANFLRLMRLPDAAQQHLEKGELTFGHAKALLSLSTPEQISEATAKILKNGLSVRQTEAMVQQTVNPESAAGEPKAKQVDPNVRDAEDQLQRKLGLKVRIHDKNGRGRVVIEYSRLEDFDTLMETLGASR